MCFIRDAGVDFTDFSPKKSQKLFSKKHLLLEVLILAVPNMINFIQNDVFVVLEPAGAQGHVE